LNAIVWFRIDLRLADNPALNAAIKHGGGVVPVFIWAPEEEAPWEPGGASRWWLHQSLLALQTKLEKLRSRLIIRRGPTLPAILAIAKETNATAVFWNRRYEPAVVARDEKLARALPSEGFKVETFNAALLHEQETIRNQSGKPYKVFTPFWKNLLMKIEPGEPLPAPKSLRPPARLPKSLPLEELELQPKIDWAGGIRAEWKPGEDAATLRLKHFLDAAFQDYSAQRNRPDVEGTSRLSPYLHFGEISPKQIWHAASRTSKTLRSSQFLAEVGWREFSHHLLHHFPRTPSEPLRPEFKKFPWRKNPAHLKAWQKGMTGYPIVDAGIRELWTTGWMHNRVRMIVASFLVKDLQLPWQQGARWFWDTLVDADLAQNTLGWQWTAGCGADAAPYFRIFNPASQAEKFDPHGDYVRRWCPELSSGTYPKPIVDHASARAVALKSFASIK
jgi:deoxyribodipyrimidine photo-lyase